MVSGAVSMSTVRPQFLCPLDRLPCQTDHASYFCTGEDAWNKATQYQLLHSVLLAGLAHTGATSTRAGKVAASLFTLGVVGFSGSIYARVATLESNPDLSNTIAQVTPKGGMTLMLAWLALAFVAPRNPALVAAAARGRAGSPLPPA